MNSKMVCWSCHIERPKDWFKLVNSKTLTQTNTGIHSNICKSCQVRLYKSKEFKASMLRLEKFLNQEGIKERIRKIKIWDGGDNSV